MNPHEATFPGGLQASMQLPRHRWNALRLLSSIALLAGLAVITVLVAWRGVGTMADAAGALGAGVLLLPAVYALHLVGAAVSWSLLFQPGRRPRFPVVLRAIWIGISVETLLPVTSLGSEAVKARLLLRSGTSGNDAVSSVVVDVTVQSLVMVFWAFVGVGALALAHADASRVWPALAGAVVVGIGIGGFLLVHRAGLFGLLARAGSRTIRVERWQGIVDGAAQLDAAIRGIYARPGRIVLACAVRCLSRAALVAELWLAAALMGQSIGAGDAVMLVGIVGALRSALFFVPAGWGVQEGGFIVLGGLLGLSPDLMLALSLATRARELMTSVPGLLAWQVAEGRALGVVTSRRSG